MLVRQHPSFQGLIDQSPTAMQPHSQTAQVEPKCARLAWLDFWQFVPHGLPDVPFSNPWPATTKPDDLPAKQQSARTHVPPTRGLDEACRTLIRSEKPSPLS